MTAAATVCWHAHYNRPKCFSRESFNFGWRHAKGIARSQSTLRTIIVVVVRVA